MKRLRYRGGGNTKTGLVFESKADLSTLINNLKDYHVADNGNVFLPLSLSQQDIEILKDLLAKSKADGFEHGDCISCEPRY